MDRPPPLYDVSLSSSMTITIHSNVLICIASCYLDCEGEGWGWGGRTVCGFGQGGEHKGRNHFFFFTGRKAGAEGFKCHVVNISGVTWVVTSQPLRMFVQLEGT